MDKPMRYLSFRDLQAKLGGRDGAKLTEAIKRLHDLLHGSDENGNRRPVFIYFSSDAADALHEFRGRCRTWEADAAGLGSIAKLSSNRDEVHFATEPA
jgi:hypothetical protein